MPADTQIVPSLDLIHLTERIKSEATSLGFQSAHIGSGNTEAHQARYEAWLDAGYNGSMSWMARNLDKRFDASKLHSGTLRSISVRMDYRPEGDMQAALDDPNRAYISRYALGRDYHKLMRKRLTQLGKSIESWVGEHGYRAFVDSAPVLERQLAQQSGMGWLGKNTLLLNQQAGSYFFLGELFTNLPLPLDTPFETQHCGSCNRCLTDCPTDAFVEAGVLDARKCISYLTIEHSGPIPVELRSKMGNRIYGCDDCQIVCPFNSFSEPTREADFQPRHSLDNISLLTLFNWDETTFLSNTEGSAIRRIGFEQWQRNLAVALGNAPTSAAIIAALQRRLPEASPLVQEHIQWALSQHNHLPAV
ncbi:tRNA epoxyqueuosine(34) reductase QueG [Saccharospirillum impatiens]|uniref:tRNA epoxyqueuosine(34) reductase QueG n=1 Tax=Saccharospirillum impatiens TaxID=169438 RepID=UPI00056CCF4F|nr:tRNA epoxyqueuosine(34) reductase QueG [Saccharospirillum impatiens]